MLDKDSYFSDAVLARELERVFEPNFQFAGMMDELSSDRDFVCVDHVGRSVVVQNFKGELKAFQNICTHRFNRIQVDDRGNRSLMCRYHGWTFDRCGYPVGLPKKEQFIASDGGGADDLRLPEYRVEVCGKFVFFTEKDSRLSLSTYLGSFYELLENLSRYMGAETHFGSVAHSANWKLLVENVLECYHCSVVHKDTFVSGLGVGLKPIEQVEFSGPHSSSHFPRVDTRREHLRRKLLAHLDAREFVHNSFFHIYIFPNLFISSTEGSSFYVGHTLPLSTGETNLRIRFFEPSIELSDSHRARQDMINQQANALGVKVIEEDRAILENIQKALPLSRRPGRLGADEIRISRFMETYASFMGGQEEASVAPVRVA